jgi:branched-subunit amino acid ABC-type transport system permease component
VCQASVVDGGATDRPKVQSEARVVKWLQLLVTGITMGSIYSLIGLGYVTIYRTSRVVNMAQGAFVMFGALFTYSFLAELGLPYCSPRSVG